MINNCRDRILQGGKPEKIWGRDPVELIEILG